MTLRPLSPSFFSASSVGTTEVSSWMMMEAEMYGMMFSAKIARRPHGAAGEHVEQPEHALVLLLEDVGERADVDAGQRNVGAEAIDEQRAEREPDSLLQLLRLGQSSEIQVSRKLLSRRCHTALRLVPWGRARARRAAALAQQPSENRGPPV